MEADLEAQPQGVAGPNLLVPGRTLRVEDVRRRRLGLLRGVPRPGPRQVASAVPRFRLVAPFAPQGDQGRCIEPLVRGVERGAPAQVLLGVTGSGKTFTIANVVERLQRPTLVISHNKTLAAQLYGEFKAFFPDNAVEYFVSYYDYYQPEAYLPQTDTYIEKDSSINDDIDRLRHSATRSLLERRDVLIVASVSCIYGLGAPEYYARLRVPLAVGEEHGLRRLLRELVDIQYQRNDLDFHRGTFRVRGDVVEIFPAYEDDAALRVEFFGDEVERITRIDPLTGAVAGALEAVTIWPGSHYVIPAGGGRALARRDRGRAGGAAGLAAPRGEAARGPAPGAADALRPGDDPRDRLLLGDRELLAPLHGPRAGRAAADAPRLLPAGLPARHRREPRHAPAAAGDVARRPLAQGDPRRVRLPAAVGVRQPAADLRGVRAARRPDASTSRRRRRPTSWSGRPGSVVEQIIRPTGLMEPAIEVRPVAGQVDDLLGEIRAARRQGRARAGHDADQAHGRGPDRALHRARAARALPALGRRDPRAAAAPARPAARASSTC